MSALAESSEYLEYITSVTWSEHHMTELAESLLWIHKFNNDDEMVLTKVINM